MGDGHYVYLCFIYSKFLKFPIHSQCPSCIPLWRFWIQISRPVAQTSVAVAVALGMDLEINKACFCCLENLHCGGETNIL